MKRRLVFFCCFALVALTIVGHTRLPGSLAGSRLGLRREPPQNQSKSIDGVWRFAINDATANVQEQRPGIRAFRRVGLDRSTLTSILRSAPVEFSGAARAARPVLTLPDPAGGFSRFSISESSIMAPELAQRFPEIKTYAGQGIDDPTATTRFDLTPLGFHAIVLSEKGTVLIEPQSLDDLDDCIVYFQSDVVGASGECDVSEQEQNEALANNRIGKSSVSPALVSSGTSLRTYRLAAAATAEYTQAYGGGTVSGGLSAITTTVNLVDAIYEREVAIRLTLIAGETSIIFTDSATDGYTSDNVNSLISENQTKLDAVIGSANYDIGHVFDGRILGGGFFSWQGLAGIGVVCLNASKGRGVDIFRSVFPTSVYAYYSAAHEMGHQFSATHTFNTTNGTCGPARTPSTAYEPMNGSTIMAYRLACPGDDLASTDTYFHSNSVEQIVNFSTNSTCAAITATGNTPPVVDAGATYTIPIGTPFTLTAVGSDPDGDALTFCWEEFDLGTAAPPNTDDGSRPIFRSFAPTSSPSRTFPSLAYVLTGSIPAGVGESMPATTRAMNFRVTARDNRTGGGGVNSAATQVNTRVDAGPFTVTQPASAVSWPAGSSQSVSWNVANTNNAPVSCANVRITLSTDGGNTFPIILANSTPNDGAETVTIPGTPSGNARVRVEAAGNIFFNISPSFTITGSTNTVPTISGFSPGSGTVGTPVTINGTNFISPTSVNFNGVSASFTVMSTTAIAATVPAGASTGPITVVTPSGTATSASNFVISTTTTIQFDSASYSVNEGDGHATITVTRTGDTSGAASVDYKTTDTDTFTVGCADKVNNHGSAYGRCDFATVVGTLSFAGGDTSKTFAVPIIDDSYAEGNETFGVALSNPSGATLGANSTATVTITDNEISDGPNPIFQTNPAGVTFFVRQHYLDFLGREPEQGEPWSAILNGCSDQFNTNPNSPAAGCDRIIVSGSFFGSPEFSTKGIYIIDFYRVALNRLPTYVEFSQDLASVTGATGAETNAKRAAYATNFVQRTDFTNIYGSMSNTNFVNALMSGMQGQAYNLTSITTPDPANPDGSTKVTLTSTDLINRLNGATLTRAQVLRAIVQSDQITQNLETVNAFVASQYYGYLRRTPDATGFNNWVNYLKANPNDFRTMVNGFVNSNEYRLRFGPL